MKTEMPIVTLSNGLRVANFSSPHEFEFEDGSILPACSNERAEELKVDFNETNIENEINGVKVKNTSLDFNISKKLWDEIYRVEKLKDIDIILVALPQLIAMKDTDFFYPEGVIATQYRTIKMVSRTDKRVRIDQFCI